VIPSTPNQILLAQTAAGGLEGFVPLILILGVFYFLLVRPQQQQAKQHTDLIASLKRGDRVVLQSGLHGRILDVEADAVMLEIGQDNDKKIKVRCDRDRIGQRLGDKKES
jgi:preprotein translocase subunit YajC